MREQHTQQQQQCGHLHMLQANNGTEVAVASWKKLYKEGCGQKNDYESYNSNWLLKEREGGEQSQLLAVALLLLVLLLAGAVLGVAAVS